MCSQRAREPEELQWASLHWRIGEGLSVVRFKLGTCRVEASKLFWETSCIVQLQLRPAGVRNFPHTVTAATSGFIDTEMPNELHIAFRNRRDRAIVQQSKHNQDVGRKRER